MQTLPLSEALFSVTQHKVLGLLYGKPDQSFYVNEIARWTRVGKGGLMRELDRLYRAGILRRSRQGNRTHYQANPDCPIHAELLGIVRKTSGIGEVLQAALAPMADRFVWAFAYGAVANGADRVGSEIDLMLIGENLSYGDVMECLLPVEAHLGRGITPTLYAPGEWMSKVASGNDFVAQVAQQERITLFGAPPPH